ncbi:hypothetical protein DFH94DRAFT_679643 [Russula ochroleuca]|uniref:Uncharacterized protein n=1 Tax=Russula ochroleuca TaxID=152965 RepID=A0A9P5N3D6_9AGAM|nr:hypothetical protein DFH94DRAFT_679643 [Russula ochroleuca]
MAPSTSSQRSLFPPQFFSTSAQVYRLALEEGSDSLGETTNKSWKGQRQSSHTHDDPPVLILDCHIRAALNKHVCDFHLKGKWQTQEHYVLRHGTAPKSGRDRVSFNRGVSESLATNYSSTSR